LELSSIFAIDIAAYAIMHNHYHVVLHIDKSQAMNWSVREVCEHWHELFSGNELSSCYLSGKTLSPIEEEQLSLKVDCWRERLTDISWFMRCLNEPIARQANQEDKATGRFWEGRFKSQALLDAKALAACMAYVDLNPIRSGMAKTPETSDHTSIQRRIKHQTETSNIDPDTIQQQPESLLPFAGNPRLHMPNGLPFKYTDYLELVDWTGRILRNDKKGAIPANTPEILSRLNIDSKHWVYLTQDFESPFKSLVGCAHQVRQACEQLGKCWVHGLKRCAEVFPDS
jgi:REP element-mobilizing transposase RayT